MKYLSVISVQGMYDVRLCVTVEYSKQLLVTRLVMSGDG